MNFKYFDRLLTEAAYDDIKVIGKDAELDGNSVHIIGMTLKDEKAYVYGLELKKTSDEEEDCIQAGRDQTRRQEFKDNCANESDIAFMRIREFHSNGKIYETAGASSSLIEKHNMAETMLLFLSMREKGWKVPEDSPFYEPFWECLYLTVVELRDEVEALPDWDKNLEIVVDHHSKTVILEIPCMLTCSEAPVIPFCLADGTQAECYINKVCPEDIWADHERRFADPEYIKRMSAYVSEQELQEMKAHVEEALIRVCPRGKCFMLVEYECSADVSVNFYAASYLNSKPQVQEGSATSLLMTHRPDAENGTHGLKLRGCIIQTPVERDAVSLDAELFSYTELVKQYTEKVY